ncbi:hypothetical protein MC885_004508, partial [Smutsia gigantea]
MLQDEIARLRKEVDTIKKSHCSRIATAVHDHEQSQASGRKLELAFQRERNEWFCFLDKINFDMSNLKVKNESLSQQLSKAEGKFCSLEIELCHTRDALRENTLLLECVRRDLSHTQCQKEEMEHRYQDKLNKHTTKQESLEERLSQLQSENELLRQQLNEAQNKAENKEKTLINIQGQFQEIIKKLQTESEKCLMLEKRNKKLINDCNHFKERLNQCESEKREKEVVVRQLQREQADTVIPQTMSEALPEVTSHYRINGQDTTQDLKKFYQVTSQVDNLTTALKISSSECLPVVTRNQVEQVLLSMTSLQKKCEKLQKTTKKLEQEVVNLKTHMEVQASSQEKLEQLRANDASLRSEMELRIKELESELSKKSYQEDSMKTKLEKYEQLYLEELKLRKSLAHQLKDLHRTNEMLAETNTRLSVEQQQNRSSLSSLTMRPVLEPPRENLVIPTSSQQISSNRMETY